MANGLFMKVANRAIYFNILDSKHLVIKEKIKDNVAKYLTDCIEDVGRPLTLKPTILGIKGRKVYDEWVELEKLPENFLK